MSALARDRNGNTVQGIRPGASQNIAVGGASALNGTAFDGNTGLLRIVSTAACRYRVGGLANGNPPMALATDTYLPAGVVEFIGIGAGEQLAVIQDSVSGTLNVTEAS